MKVAKFVLGRIKLLWAEFYLEPYQKGSGCCKCYYYMKMAGGFKTKNNNLLNESNLNICVSGLLIFTSRLISIYFLHPARVGRGGN